MATTQADEPEPTQEDVEKAIAAHNAEEAAKAAKAAEAEPEPAPAKTSTK